MGDLLTDVASSGRPSSEKRPVRRTRLVAGYCLLCCGAAAWALGGWRLYAARFGSVEQLSAVRPSDRWLFNQHEEQIAAFRRAVEQARQAGDNTSPHARQWEADLAFHERAKPDLDRLAQTALSYARAQEWNEGLALLSAGLTLVLVGAAAARGKGRKPERAGTAG